MTDNINSAVKKILKDPEFPQKSLAYMVMGVLVASLYKEEADVELTLQTISFLSERIDEIDVSQLMEAKSITEVMALLVPDAFGTWENNTFAAPAEQC